MPRQRIRQTVSVLLLGLLVVLSSACAPAPTAKNVKTALETLGVSGASCNHNVSTSEITCTGRYKSRNRFWSGVPVNGTTIKMNGTYPATITNSMYSEDDPHTVQSCGVMDGKVACHQFLK